MLTRSVARILFLLLCFIFVATSSPVFASSHGDRYTERVEAEIAVVRALIQEGNPDRFFENPYLISTLYYSHQFLYGRGAREEEYAFRITQALRDMITSEIRERYMKYLKILTIRSVNARALRQELPTRPFSVLDTGEGAGHQDALDLFVREGTMVGAVLGGIVVLAEENWSTSNPFSASSPNCGNTVIIYNVFVNQFFRYCHLKNVFVNTKDIVGVGAIVGSVGSSGIRASRKGHGDHLHLEIHEYNSSEKTIRALTRSEIETFLNSINP